jgi:hypothetical protein
VFLPEDLAGGSARIPPACRAPQGARPSELKSFATDDQRQNVCAYGVFLGTHTGPGGLCPPTGESVKTDYVYVMEFDKGKIRHMTKIWKSGFAVKELGWA